MNIEDKEKETNDMITAEDLVEQAVYMANAPEGVSDAEKAEDMLSMLGANIMDETVYEDKPPTIRIKDIFDNDVDLIPDIVLHEVNDFMGEPQYNLGLRFLCEHNGSIETYCNFTVNLGEFIGTKNCAYVDTDECCYFADTILKSGIAQDTGLTKRNGHFDYPLWKFDESFLLSLNSEQYQKYSDSFDEYMAEAFGESIQDMRM